MSVQVTTNCFTITRLPQKQYHQYDVFSPEEKIPRKRQEIIHKLQTIVAPNVFSPRGIYDGKAIMYVSHQLHLAGAGSGSFIVGLGEKPPVAGQPGVYRVKLTRTAGDPVTPSDLKKFIAGPQAATNRTMTATNLLQLLIRQSTNQMYTHNNRAYFSPVGAQTLSDGLELWRGFFQSVRPTIGRMLINIDTTIATVYQSGALMDVAMSHLGVRDVRGISFPQNDVRFRKLDKFLHNLRINTRTTNKRTKTIKGLVPSAGYYEFEKDGRMMTVRDYFRSAWNINLQHPDAFGVRLSGKNAPFPVVVPAELCTVLPGQFYKKKLPNHLTADAVRFATLRPQQRLEKIVGSAYGGGELESPIRGYASSEYVVESGMQVDINPISVSGRMLPPPSLMFGQRQVNPLNGAWNVVGQKFSIAAKMERWVVVTFSDRLRPQNCRPIVQGLMESCMDLGMVVHEPAAIEAGNGHDVQRSLVRAGMAAAQRLGCGTEKLQMMVVILPQKAEEIRQIVKHWGDILAGLPTNCMREDKLSRANNQYYNNIALKLNARLGGINSTVRSGILGSLAKSPFMIMGADVSHPSPGALRPSISSLVYSHDMNATQYAAITRAQHPREEMISDLQEMFKTAIESFGLKMKCPPERIIFYRDGISEGEFAEVGQAEIAKLKAGIDEIWLEKGAKEETKPKLTYIVVGKRHHIAFFPNNNSEAHDRKTGNCKPGFATAPGQLANPTVQDFYLQSHAAIQGTSRSSRYIVLRDDNFNRDHALLQELSFALCHVYSKATRSVSIPAPVYYADLACGRGAFHYGPDVNFEADDSTSVSGGAPTFDIESWTSHYKPVGGRLTTKMYFL